MTVLESLDISENRLSTLNVGALLRLRHLNVDSNGIVRIRGTRRLRDLERVSWRGQELEDPENNIHMHYACCLEARTLHLSTNRIHKFVTPVPLFLLQRLEIASAGLDELSENFGYHVPNLRYLNLNHNAIKDIKPLLGIEYLHELHLAGNRLAKLRRTITVLSAVGRSLEILDCRINPLSLGFYPAPIGMESSRTASLESKSETKLLTSGTWEEEDEATEALYTGASIDEDSDRQHRGRLDEETSLRRRVYEMMLAHGCENLSRLDGMTLDRRRILQKDKHWERLVVLGIVKVDIEEELTRNLTTRTDEHRDAMPQPNSKAKRSMKPKTPMKSRIHSVKAGGSDECIDSRTPRGHPADLWGEESVRL